MVYKGKVAVCSEIRTKHTTQSEHHVEFLNVKLVVHTETARLCKVNNIWDTVELDHCLRNMGQLLY